MAASSRRWNCTTAFFRATVFAGAAMSYVQPAWTQEDESATTRKGWVFDPRLSVALIYSDNVDRDPPGFEHSDWISELVPGFFVSREGARAQFFVDYDFIARFFARDGDRNNSSHRLEARGLGEVVEDWFFFEGSATAGQTIVDAAVSTSTRGLTTRNRSDFFSFTLSPYLEHSFGGRADVFLGYAYEEVRVERGASDSVTHRVEGRANSGVTWSGPLSWTAEFQYADTQRESGNNPVYNNGQADGRYRLSSEFYLLGQAGYADNDTNRVNSVNGSYWAVGFGWIPVRFVEMAALTGRNLDTASITVHPTRRTDIGVTWRHQKVGLNTDPQWSGFARHRTRRSTWRASYTERVTTTQSVLAAEGGGTNFFDPTTGDPVVNPGPGDLVVQEQALQGSLTDAEFLRKIGVLSVGFRTGKSAILLRGTDERREFDFQADERIQRASLGWTWRWRPKTTTILVGSLTDFDRTLSRSYDQYEITAAVNHRLSSRLSASLEYYRSEKDGAGSENLNDYTENRLTARLIVGF